MKVDPCAETEAEDDICSRTLETSLRCASNWLTTCLGTHEKCREDQVLKRSGYVPTRLLQIGYPSHDMVRLRTHGELTRTQLQYATISHCWGTSSVFKLTSTSMPDLKQGIAVSELSQVVQDTIYVAQCLGIKYLWIDSLCILQGDNSEEDWRREAGRMSDVYSGSILNIAATMAADCETNCFPERSSSAIGPCTIQTAWTKHNHGQFLLYHHNFWDDSMKNMPLSKRAWVVQELLLAPRVLHLCGTQLFWECYELAACETYPSGVPSNMIHEWRTRELLWQCFRNTETQQQHVNRTVNPKTELILRRLWAQILRDYTQKQLTYPADKLIALSGIVLRMEHALGDQYCAGLWKRNMVVELAWTRNDGVRPSRRLTEYRAPSWSWASVDGAISPVTWDKDEHHMTVRDVMRVIDIRMEYATNSPCGAVTEGCLRLSGSLATLQFLSVSDENKQFLFDGKWRTRGTFQITFDCEPLTPQLHCFPLFIANYASIAWTAICLLLEPTGARKGQFRRVGWIRGRLPLMGIVDWEDFGVIRNETWFEYEAIDGDGKYIVSII